MSRKYKILSITLKKEKKKKRYIVTLSNNNAFEVSEDVLIDKSLYINKEIYKTDLNKILLRESFSNVREAALVLLNYRMRSKKELEYRLLKKGYNKKTISMVIEELEDKGWVDDEKFCLAFGKDQINKNKIGPIALKYRLKEYIDSLNLIEKLSDRIYSELNIENIIMQILAKYPPEKIKKEDNLKRKIINKLKRKGHYWQDIEGTLNKYLNP